MKIGIPKESFPGEKRVMATPATVNRLTQVGWEVVVESGAGVGAGHADSEYVKAGAVIVGGNPNAGPNHQTAEIDSIRTHAWWGDVDVLAKVRAPQIFPDGTSECDGMREGTLLISFLNPDLNGALMERLAARKASALAIDKIPRISRAQKVDALSAMANIAGYRAVIEAAGRFGRFFTGQMTAAGKVPPAQVLVIGAGVAGLAAIAAAKGLGGLVRAFDVRPAVADQIKSLGAEFLTVTIEETGEGQGGYAKEMSPEFIAAEMELFRKQAAQCDIVITTAMIPGKPAPKLWLADMVQRMKPGSVVVDLAAESGGNCEWTVPGEAVVRDGVTLIGYTDLPSRMAGVASDLLGGILFNLTEEMGGSSRFGIDLDNEIVRGALALSRGNKVVPPLRKPEKDSVKTPVPAGASAPQAKSGVSAVKEAGHNGARAGTGGPGPAGHGHGSHAPAPPSRMADWTMAGFGILAALAWVGLRYHGSGEAAVGEGTRVFLEHFTVFVMAIFVGWQVIWNVTPALHTPLMSVTNATSGIILVGGIIGARAHFDVSASIALLAALFATINIVGGFMVTRRMLLMFRK